MLVEFSPRQKKPTFYFDELNLGLVDVIDSSAQVMALPIPAIFLGTNSRRNWAGNYSAADENNGGKLLATPGRHDCLTTFLSSRSRDRCGSTQPQGIKADITLTNRGPLL